MSNKTPQQQHSRSECGDRQPCDPARSLLRDYSVELREMAFKKWLRPSGNSWDFLFSSRAELSLCSLVLNAEVEDKSSQTKRNLFSNCLHVASCQPAWAGWWITHPTLTERWAGLLVLCFHKCYSCQREKPLKFNRNKQWSRAWGLAPARRHGISSSFIFVIPKVKW